MSSKNDKTGQSSAGKGKADSRNARLAEALRANLRKRKAQARARQAENDGRTGEQDPKGRA